MAKELRMEERDMESSDFLRFVHGVCRMTFVRWLFRTYLL